MYKKNTVLVLLGTKLGASVNLNTVILKKRLRERYYNFKRAMFHFTFIRITSTLSLPLKSLDILIILVIYSADLSND